MENTRIREDYIMKKILSLVLALALITAMFSWCGTKRTEDGTVKEGIFGRFCS